MNKESPVKGIFYKEIEKMGENYIQKFISEKKSEKIINKILEKCLKKIQNEANGFPTFVTVCLHYFLTQCLIPTQRKIVKNGVDFDIIIPDFQTLEKNPKNTILLVIPQTSEKDSIVKRLSELKAFQPYKENCWVIVENQIELPSRVFSPHSEKNNLSSIVNEIERFLSSKKIDRLKILR